MIAYYNGNYIPMDEINISPEDRGFLFADGIYEVIRSYNGNLFCLDDHLNRLNSGARALEFRRVEFDEIATVCRNLIIMNGLEKGDSLVYIQITRGAAVRMHRFPDSEVELTVYASIKPFKQSISQQNSGVNVILVSDQRWDRCDVKTVNLIANVIANQKAYENSAYEALFIRNGVVLEGSHSNFFMVAEGRVVTHPLTNHVLPGVTRKAVIELCKELSIPLVERPIFESELFRANELIITGTTIEVTPVISISNNLVASGKPGPVTIVLQNAIKNMIRKQCH